MPTHRHEQRPDDDRPPPCGCGGCAEFRAITLHPRREIDRDVRRAKRVADRRQQRRLEEQAAEREAVRLRQVL